jgi:hypothetical protein
MSMSNLKRVPKGNRISFFEENRNTDKYYYTAIGDAPQHPFRNTLIPLGTFVGFSIDYNAFSGLTKLTFSDAPFQFANGISIETDPLLYTDELPAVGSVPLHYYDYATMDIPAEHFPNGRMPVDHHLTYLGFGDGENGMGVQSLRPPGSEYPLLTQSRLGAQNWVKKGGKTKKSKRKHQKRKSHKKKNRSA